MRAMRHGIGLLGLAVVTAASCASPAVTLYALGAAGGGEPSAPVLSALQPGAVVIEVARVTLPDYLDTQDILVRRGSALDASHAGRWASRLSLGATALLVARLSRTRPDALVTDQQQATAPSYRLLVNISRFDVAAEPAGTGRATLDADWLIVPRDTARPTLRSRITLEAAGPVGSDPNVVALQTTLLSRLADAIDITRLR